jgi:hypothetical protein
VQQNLLIVADLVSKLLPIGGFARIPMAQLQFDLKKK